MSEKSLQAGKMKTGSIKRWRGFAASFVFVCGLCAGTAQASLTTKKTQTAQTETNSLLAEGNRALNEGIPQVAIQKFRAYLAENPSRPDSKLASQKLADALIQAGEPKAALKFLKKSADAKNPQTLFLEAQANAAIGQYAEAAPLYLAAAKTEKDSSLANAAALGAAEAQYLLGETQTAIQTLENAPHLSAIGSLRLAGFYFDEKQTDQAQKLMIATNLTKAPLLAKKWKRYLDARLLLANGDPKKAWEKLQPLLKASPGLSQGLFAAVILVAANAKMATDGPDAADDGLENFIQSYPQSRALPLLMERLSQIYSKQENPTESVLVKWALEKDQPRSSYALYYLAKLQLHQGDAPKALKTITGFLSYYSAHPLQAEAYFLRGKILLQMHSLKPAIAAFDAALKHARTTGLRAQIEMLSGATHFQQHDYAPAAKLFSDAANDSAPLEKAALFNEALAWLQQGNLAKFDEVNEEFNALNPKNSLRADLIFEKSLTQARQKNPAAIETLRQFAQEFPDSPRLPEANLALAEIAYFVPPQNLHEANQYIRAALSKPDGKKADEQAEYLAIFVADAATPPDSKKVIALGKQFLKKYPASNLLPQVRMKLGQVYFQQEDFANAATQFETIAHESPASKYAETALFLAGRCAIKMRNVDHALDLFDEVAKYNGTLKLYAREQQAVIQNLRGKELEAVIIYDTILSAKPAPPQRLKFAAMCGKGDSLFASGKAHPKQYLKAIKVFESLAKQRGVTPYWRDQALYKKGLCLEKEDEPEKAIAAYYDVLNLQQSGPDTEYFWFYKAGFRAGQILEKQNQWKSAIAIYEKIALLKGPRQQEAKDRADQLRLKHFIWSE